VVSQNFEDKKSEISGSLTKDVLVLKKPAHLSQEFWPEIFRESNYEIVGFEPEKSARASFSQSSSSVSILNFSRPFGEGIESFLRVESLFLLRIFLDFFSQKALHYWLFRVFSEENQRLARTMV
jgi:hypothetical protein